MPSQASSTAKFCAEVVFPTPPFSRGRANNIQDILPNFLANRRTHSFACLHYRFVGKDASIDICSSQQKTTPTKRRSCLPLDIFLLRITICPSSPCCGVAKPAHWFLLCLRVPLFHCAHGTLLCLKSIFAYHVQGTLRTGDIQAGCSHQEQRDIC